MEEKETTLITTEVEILPETEQVFETTTRHIDPENYYEDGFISAHWPLIMGTVFFIAIGGFLPLMVPKGPNKSLIRLMLALTAFWCWIFWIVCYISQMYPLFGPVLTYPQLLLLKKYGGKMYEDL